MKFGALCVFCSFAIFSCNQKNNELSISWPKAVVSMVDSISIITNNKRECFGFKMQNRSVRYVSWFKKSNDILVHTTNSFDSEFNYTERCQINRHRFSIISDKGELKRDLIEFDSLKVVMGYSLFGDSLLAVLTENIVCKETNQSVFYNPELELYKIDDSVLRRIEKYNLDDSLNFLMSESSWNLDGTEIVLSSKSFGIYILNVPTGKLSRISQEGRMAVWNPKYDEIAYLVQGDLWLYDCATSKCQLLLKSGLLNDFSITAWHPTGDFILLAGAFKIHVGIFSFPICFWLNKKSGEIIEDTSCGLIDKSWK
jgi:hypothetical protein